MRVKKIKKQYINEELYIINSDYACEGGTCFKALSSKYNPYRIIYIAAVLIGSVVNLAIVWNLADCMNALMAIPNLISLLCLSGVMVHETRKYLWRGQLDKEMEDTTFYSNKRNPQP